MLQEVYKTSMNLKDTKQSEQVHNISFRL